MALACKDGTLRLVDPRGAGVVAKSGVIHGGAKAFRAAWQGAHERIVTAGFNSSSEREVAVFDVRKLDKWLGRAAVDVNSGILELDYDEDSNVCFVSGRGDTTIRLFDVSFVSLLCFASVVDNRRAHSRSTSRTF